MRRALALRHRHVAYCSGPSARSCALSLWSPPTDPPRLRLPDDVGNGAALRARREGQRHAVLENGFGEIAARRRSRARGGRRAARGRGPPASATGWRGPGPRRSACRRHHGRPRSARQRPGSPRRRCRRPAAPRSRCAAIRISAFIEALASVSSAPVVSNRMPAFGVAVGIVDVDLIRKRSSCASELDGAFLLQRVLRGEHVERLRQIVRRACNGDVLFLHGLQAAPIGSAAGAVDSSAIRSCATRAPR